MAGRPVYGRWRGTPTEQAAIMRPRPGLWGTEKVDVLGTRETLARRDALLHAARRCAAEASSEAVLRTLLEEAIKLLGADDGGVARWDTAARQLVQVESYIPSENLGTVL